MDFENAVVSKTDQNLYFCGAHFLVWEMKNKADKNLESDTLRREKLNQGEEYEMADGELDFI